MSRPSLRRRSIDSQAISVDSENISIDFLSSARDSTSSCNPSEISSFIACTWNKLERRVSLDQLLTTPEPTNVKEWKLTKLASILATTVLRDGITALQILRTTSKLTPAIINLDWIESKSLGDMLGTGAFDERIHTRFKNRSEIDQEKIESDRAVMEAILSDTISKLKMRHNFSGLVKMMESFLKRREEEEHLLTVAVHDQKKMMRLRKMRDRNKRKYERNTRNIVQSIGKLNDELMNTLFENETKIKYLDNWENARNEQNRMVLEMKENEFQTIIDETNAEMNKEKVVHGAIMDFLKEMITDHQSAIEKWMNKYDADLEKKEMECQTMKARMDDQHEDLEFLQETFKKRHEEIEDYLKDKERKRLERAELYKRNEAATKIQAWWRSVMLRKGLGPYKKKGKGKKGDKGKKGRGGKKK